MSFIFSPPLESRAYAKTPLEESKFLLLRKVFPSIQADRDLDLEQYVLLRCSGKEVEKWKFHYNRLIHKYTPAERTLLIHVLRKYAGDFERIFAGILERLYLRLEFFFRQKIDLILGILGDVNAEGEPPEPDKRRILKLIERALEVCSLNHAMAVSDLELVEYFASTFAYRKDDFLSAARLLKLYLSGMLFVARREYKFDINAEKRKALGESLPAPVAQSGMSLFISARDLQQMLVADELESEYDLAFAYYERYTRHCRDVNFANKLFLYSQTYNTSHFRIFECIKRGVQGKFRRERIFDDIFKLICRGRYVYDLNKERQIQRKILMYHRALEMMEKMQRRANRLKSSGRDWERPFNRTVSGRQTLPSSAPVLIPPPVEPEFAPPLPSLPAAATQPRTGLAPATISARTGQSPHPRAASSVAREPSPVLPAACPPVQPAVASSLPVGKRSRSGWEAAKSNRKSTGEQEQRTISMLISELASAPKDTRMLLEEFKGRLAGYAARYYKELPGIHLEEETALRQFKEFIRYSLQNYDKILAAGEQKKQYATALESFGFSLNLFYTVVFECFMDLKSDYLLNNLQAKAGFFGLFGRMFGKKSAGSSL